MDSEHYLFALHKYIEMNPLKAKMIKVLSEYKWSSYLCNALGKTDNLVTPHSLYEALGESNLHRCERYREIFSGLDIDKQQSQITEATLRGEVYGSEMFHRKISSLVSRATKLTTHGGDRKSDVYRGQAD